MVCSRTLTWRVFQPASSHARWFDCFRVFSTSPALAGPCAVTNGPGCARSRRRRARPGRQGSPGESPRGAGRHSTDEVLCSRACAVLPDRQTRSGAWTPVARLSASSRRASTTEPGDGHTVTIERAVLWDGDEQVEALFRPGCVFLRFASILSGLPGVCGVVVLRQSREQDDLTLHVGGTYLPASVEPRALM